MNNSLILEIKQIIKSEKLDIDLNLSDELLIQEFQNKVNWYLVSRFQELSEEFIEKFQDKVDWASISVQQKLSESFIEKFQDDISWNCISMKQKLSESFIEKFQDKINWGWISSYQKLSEKFILKYWNKLDHQLIIENQNSLTPAFLCWLYRTYQEEEYNLLKYKNDDFKEYALKIEEEVKIVMIEII